VKSSTDELISEILLDNEFGVINSKSVVGLFRIDCTCSCFGVLKSNKKTFDSTENCSIYSALFEIR